MGPKWRERYVSEFLAQLLHIQSRRPIAYFISWIHHHRTDADQLKNVKAKDLAYSRIAAECYRHAAFWMVTCPWILLAEEHELSDLMEQNTARFLPIPIQEYTFPVIANITWQSQQLNTRLAGWTVEQRQSYIGRSLTTLQSYAHVLGEQSLERNFSDWHKSAIIAVYSHWIMPAELFQLIVLNEDLSGDRVHQSIVVQAYNEYIAHLQQTAQYLATSESSEISISSDTNDDWSHTRSNTDV